MPKARELANVPFPECTKNCEAIEYLGVGECEAVCPEKFTKPKRDKTFIELYEKAIKEGEKHFGSVCDHSETKDGVCLKCLRGVLDDDKNIFQNIP